LVSVSISATPHKSSGDATGGKVGTSEIQEDNSKECFARATAGGNSHVWLEVVANGRSVEDVARAVSFLGLPVVSAFRAEEVEDDSEEDEGSDDSRSNCSVASDPMHF